jgi:DNA polymerase-3 subunit gamma/tau
MAYTVFARRYRPLLFHDVVGQEHVTRTLTNALKKGKVAHAYLFAGPRGVGKTTTARILAKAVNCTDLQDGEPCNKCPTCTDINDGRSLDILEIDGASNRGIDEIRNLRENVKFAPASGTRKVYIIDEVHQLTSAAFNALLKTLEEPPSHVLFIFATTEAHQVPPTILSRCQRFDFHRISSAAIRGNIEMICTQEKIKADPEVMELVTRKADGSLRDAQSLLDQLVAFCGDTLQAREVEEVLGLIPLDTLFETIRIFRERNSGEAFKLCDDLAAQGADYGHFLRELAQHLVRLMRVKTTGQALGLEVGADVQERYIAEAKKTNLNDIFRWLRLIQDAELAVKRSPAPRIRFETDFMKIATMDASVDLDTLLKKLDSLGDGSSEGVEPSEPEPPALQSKLPINESPNPTASKPPTMETFTATVPPAAPPDATPGLELFRSKWNAICDALSKDYPSLGAFLREGHPSEFHDKTLTITMDEGNGFHIEQLKKEDAKVRKAIQDMVHAKPILKYVLGQVPSEAKADNAVKPSTETIIDQVRKKNPSIDSLLKRIDGQPLN